MDSDNEDLAPSDNEDLISSSVTDEDATSRKDEALSRLENIALSFLSQLAGALSSDPGMQNKRKITLLLAARNKMRCENESRQMQTHIVQYPRNGKGGSAKHLANVLKIVDVAHEALIQDNVLTKRETWRHLGLFKGQAVVDKLVDDLAATFTMSRSDLNIRASCKGLFCGSCLIIHAKGGGTIDGNDTQPSLIPVMEDIARLELDEAVTWILVVEKEAVFQTLCKIDFANNPSLPGPGLIITGKGYPDLATRQLIKSLSENIPDTIPFLVFVDADPHGIDIASVYKYGSLSMRHERNSLVVDKIEWIGLRSNDLIGLGVDYESLLPISNYDYKKALSMLRGTLPDDWRKEIMLMLHSRRKAEIEVLASGRLRYSQTRRNLTDDFQNVNDILTETNVDSNLNPLTLYLIKKIKKAIASKKEYN